MDITLGQHPVRHEAVIFAPVPVDVGVPLPQPVLGDVGDRDVEVAELKGRYQKVKSVSDEWMKKADTLVKEWKLLDNTVNELNSWVAKDRGAEGEQNFSLEKMESTLGELKNIFKQKEKLVENL